MLNDLRYALRWLTRSPGFAAVAILSLGLGIGVNTAMFSLVDAVLLRPIHVRDPDSLVDVFTNSSDGDEYATSSYPDFLDLKAQNTVFTDMIAYTPMLAPLNLGDRARMVIGQLVTSNHFEMLGIRPLLGRMLQPADDVPGADRVVVISHRMWQSEFGSDHAIVGRGLQLRGQGYTIVGVAPGHFTGVIPLLIPELWLPITHVEEVEPAGIIDNVPSPTGRTRIERRGSRSFFVKGRLKLGATASQAHANVSLIGTELAAAFPQTNRNRRMSAFATHEVRLLVPQASGPILDWLGRADGGRGSRAADCVRQRDRDAACTVVRAHPRDQRSPCDRRQPNAAHSATVERRARVGSVGRGGGRWSGLGIDPAPRVDRAPDPGESRARRSTRPPCDELRGIAVVAGLLAALTPALKASSPRLAGDLRGETPGAMRRELLAMEPGLVFISSTTMETSMEASLLPHRVSAMLASAFGGLGTLLAGIGLCGVIAFSVARRTREIGVRMAVGADRPKVLGMIMKQGLGLVAIGAAVGILLAAAAARFLSGVLYDTGAFDPVAWTGALGVLLVASALANFIPARRAMRVDPVTALRTE